MALKIASAGLLFALALISVELVEGQSLDSRLECRMLPATSCAFAVDSYGARCLLEAHTVDDLTTVYSCQTSKILAAKEEEHIETEECVSSCGVDRLTVGISTNAFFSPGFTQKLCSVECQKNCVNIVDLYSKVVARTSEGASLAKFCSEVQASQGLQLHLRSRKLIV